MPNWISPGPSRTPDEPMHSHAPEPTRAARQPYGELGTREFGVELPGTPPSGELSHVAGFPHSDTVPLALTVTLAPSGMTMPVDTAAVPPLSGPPAVPGTFTSAETALPGTAATVRPKAARVATAKATNMRRMGGL